MHDLGWTVTLGGDGRARFRSPEGTEVPADPTVVDVARRATDIARRRHGPDG
ncbi:MAG: hypothetical protein U5R31_00775 [Acidimicrobiia bacterium]|nr:hypothetical protein [Acidimicrobiia bacterium]